MGVFYAIAEDGQEAIDIVSKSLSEGHIFDLVFLKLIMPVISGFEAAKEIREIEARFQLT